MARKILASIFMVMVFVAVRTAGAQPVTLGYVDFPPYEYEQDGRPAGILVNIVQTIFETENIPLHLRFLPFRRALEETKSGKIDGLFNFYKTEERLEFYDYSDPIIKNPLVFFVRKDSPLRYNRLEDLKGLTVGAMLGYTYGTDFDNSTLFTRSDVASHTQNFIKLVLGRIDAYPCDKLVGLHVATRNDLMSELNILPTPLMVMDGHIGFTKSKHRETIRRINSAIEKMHESGAIQKMIDRYIEHMFMQQAPLK